MARPRKDGVDYFPFDADFFSDDKIKLLMARHGAEGVTVYIYLLTRIYSDKGYYLEWQGEDSDYLTAHALGINIAKAAEIRSYLLERSLFDSGLFRTAQVLSSRGIQRRYQQAVKTRAVKNPVSVREEYWLLDGDETEPFIRVRSKNDSSAGSSETSESSTGSFGDTHCYSGNNPDSSLNNTADSMNYSTKQSKADERKANQSRSEQITAQHKTANWEKEAETASGGVPGCAVPADENDNAYDFYDAHNSHNPNNSHNSHNSQNAHSAQWADDAHNADNMPDISCVTAEFEQIKKPSAMDIRRLGELVEIYGENQVVAGIRDARRKGGRSLAYVERILEDSRISRPPQAPAVQRQRDTGLYPPTFDYSSIEAMMFDEWFGDELSKGTNDGDY